MIDKGRYWWFSDHYGPFLIGMFLEKGYFLRCEIPQKQENPPTRKGERAFPITILASTYDFHHKVQADRRDYNPAQYDFNYLAFHRGIYTQKKLKKVLYFI